MKAAKAEIRDQVSGVRERRSGELRDISIAHLNDAPWNARKSFDDGAISELAESIRQDGLLNPIIVRPIDAETFEIVSGHRRFRAVQKLGFNTIHCIVLELDEDHAREVGLVDNLQREDVPAMEEAQAFNELLTRLGSVAAVAARVGKEQGYVAKRLKLCTLTLCAQDALREKLITIDHALLLARVGADEQDELLKWCLDHTAGSKKPVEKVLEERLAGRNSDAEMRLEGDHFSHSWEPQSVQRLKDHMAGESGTPLARAPWPLDEDYLIPDDPICAVCPQNTSANAPLFADLAVGEPTCTDGACFRAKTEAFVQIKLREAGDRGSKVAMSPLRVSWKYTSTPPRLDKETGAPSLTQVFKAGQWGEVKKKCEHALAAVTVDWSDVNYRGYMGGDAKLRKPGEILEVCIEPKCAVHSKEYAKAPATKSSSGPAASPKQTEADKERKKQAAIAENKIRTFVISAALEKVKRLPEEYLREIISNYAYFYGEEERAVNAILPGINKIISNAPIDGPQFAQAVTLISLGDCIYCAADGDPAMDRKELIAALKKLGYDASKAWDKPEKQPLAVSSQPSVKSAKKKPAKKAPAKAAKKAAAKKGGRR